MIAELRKKPQTGCSRPKRLFEPKELDSRCRTRVRMCRRNPRDLPGVQM